MLITLLTELRSSCRICESMFYTLFIIIVKYKRKDPLTLTLTLTLNPNPNLYPNLKGAGGGTLGSDHGK